MTELKKLINDVIENPISNEQKTDKIIELFSVYSRKPMKNIVKRLEECYERYEDLEYYEHLENGHSLDFEYCHGKKDGVNEAIEIVKEEGGVDV